MAVSVPVEVVILPILTPLVVPPVTAGGVILRPLIVPPVAAVKLRQDEMFEKPGRMRQVPLDRADIRHALHDEILRFQMPAQQHGGRANGHEACRQCCQGRI